MTLYNQDFLDRLRRAESVAFCPGFSLDMYLDY